MLRLELANSLLATCHWPQKLTQQIGWKPRAARDRGRRPSLLPAAWRELLGRGSWGPSPGRCAPLDAALGQETALALGA